MIGLRELKVDNWRENRLTADALVALEDTKATYSDRHGVTDYTVEHVHTGSNSVVVKYVDDNGDVWLYRVAVVVEEL